MKLSESGEEALGAKVMEMSVRVMELAESDEEALGVGLQKCR